MKQLNNLSQKEKLRFLTAVALLILSISSLTLIWYLGYLAQITAYMHDIFQDRQHIRDYIAGWGDKAPIAFILLQVFQVLFAPIPGEATGFIGGFLFGAFWNVVYSTIGLTIGSALAFGIAHVMGKPIVEVVVGEATFHRLEFLTKPSGIFAALAAYMIPGMPKDILSYLFGLSPMPFKTFIVVCGLGRIPGTIMLSVSGSSLYSGNWLLFALMVTISVALFVLGYFKRQTILGWLEKLHGKVDL